MQQTSNPFGAMLEGMAAQHKQLQQQMQQCEADFERSFEESQQEIQAFLQAKAKQMRRSMDEFRKRRVQLSEQMLMFQNMMAAQRMFGGGGMGSLTAGHTAMGVDGAIEEPISKPNQSPRKKNKKKRDRPEEMAALPFTQAMPGMDGTMSSSHSSGDDSHSLTEGEEGDSAQPSSQLRRTHSSSSSSDESEQPAKQVASLMSPAQSAAKQGSKESEVISPDSKSTAASSSSAVPSPHTASKKHKSAVMAAETPVFKCDECGESFSRKSQLSRHAKSHEKAAGFECGKCQRRFSSENTCKVHRQSCGKGGSNGSMLSRSETKEQEWDRSTQRMF